MRVFFDGVGTESEDQISSLVFTGFLVIDLFSFDCGADIFLVVFLRLFTGAAGAFYRFQSQVSGVALDICDLKTVIFNILGRYSVFALVDRVDLLVRQVKTVGKAVPGNVIGRVNSISGECVAEIHTDDIRAVQLCVLVRLVPVGNSGAVLNFLVFRHMVVVDACPAVQDGLELQFLFFRNIGISVFRIFICTLFICMLFILICLILFIQSFVCGGIIL